ncbi:hypothetical protein Q6302_28945, partial [Klebsiella pneumoniae]|nr:hypothetical protein [Klebsiella pneumoniae]
MRILSMRDQSEQELRRKLFSPVISKNGPDALDVTPDELEQVVAWCIENRYYAHALGKKFYVVVNIAPDNAKLKTFIRDL